MQQKENALQNEIKSKESIIFDCLADIKRMEGVINDLKRYTYPNLFGS